MSVHFKVNLQYNLEGYPEFLFIMSYFFQRIIHIHLLVESFPGFNYVQNLLNVFQNYPVLILFTVIYYLFIDL